MPKSDLSASDQSAILVVDDDAVLRKMLALMLTKSGYTVLEANDGLQALAVLKQKPVHGILLDVMMPGIDGFEVCRRVKSEPPTAHIPVVIVSALGGDKDRQRGLEAGADEFISKPVDPTRLLSVMQRVMPRSGHGSDRE